jgi:hypothetical protein
LIELSPQQIIDCDMESMGCEGGSIIKAFKYVIRHGGIVKEQQFPYKGIQHSYCHDENSETTVKITSFRTLVSSEIQLRIARVVRRPMQLQSLAMEVKTEIYFG